MATTFKPIYYMACPECEGVEREAQGCWLCAGDRVIERKPEPGEVGSVVRLEKDGYFSATAIRGEDLL